MNNIGKPLRTVITIIFWIVVSFFFCFNSSLRPLLPVHLEIIVIILIISSIYVEKHLLIPHILLKRKYLLFSIFSVAIIAADTTIEFWIAYPFIRRCFASPNMGYLKDYCSDICIFTFLRNAAFYVFFLVFFLYRRFKQLMEEEQKVIAWETGHIAILLANNKVASVNINKIRYFRGEKNTVFIELKSGQHYKQFSSLNDIERCLPADKYLRINRNNLILYDSVNYYTSTELFLCGMTEPLSFYEKRSNDILCKLLKWDAGKFRPSNNEIMSRNGDLAGLNAESHDEFSKNGGIKTEFSEENRGQRRKSANEEIVLEYIRRHERCKLLQISKGTCLSLRTVERIIQQLKKDEAVCYVGPKKTGGYSVIPNKS
ncbi:MAG: LytTR family transcriptional regulator DNA-binding domain-containing protein [Bacteroidales bacterium]|nr:LytTR family transcriptional regulator DNA-binding domain-containing protein [Bacteroidales bacterium]